MSFAVDLIEAHSVSFLGLITRNNFLKSYRLAFELLIDCCATLGENSMDRRRQAFDLVETIKWGLFTSVIRFSPMRLHGHDNHPLLAKEDALMRVVGDTLISPSHQAAGDHVVEQALRELKKIWTELEQIDPEYVAIRRQGTIKADEVRGLLDPQVPVLVEYYLGEYKKDLALAFVFIASEPGLRIVRLPEIPKAIYEEIDLLRRQDDSKPIEEFDRPARRLHRILVEPLLGFLPEETGICFVPFSDLHNLPFNALFDGERYLIERNSVIVAPSATALRWWVRNNTRKPQRGLIVTATHDVTIDHERAVDLADFERLARLRIAPLFPVSLVVPPGEATKARLLIELADVKDPPWDVVHIACHAVFESGAARLIMLGDPSDPAKDLMAQEIFTFVRPSATLVTLSACETAVADAATNDEIVGLAQGFLFGGASSVLASQWYVVQGVGVELTREFYASWMGLE